MYRLLLLCVVLVSATTGSAQSDTSFTYQGELTENGALATGNHSMRFSLWDAPAAGTQIGSTIIMNAVSVAGGRFDVSLDFGPGAFDNTARWLQIQVEGTTLSPRQPINRSPYSIQTRGIFVDADKNVGIGTDAPLDELHIAGDNATLRLEDTTDPGGYTLFEDAQPTQLRISKTNASADNDGTVLLDLNPKPLNGFSSALIRFFRETDTVGAKRVQFLRGNFTTSTSAEIGVDGQDSFFQAHGGFLGVGTASPSAALDVAGDGNFRNRLGIGNPASLFGQVTISDSNDGAIFALEAESRDSFFPTLFAVNSGGGAALWAVSPSDATAEGGGAIVIGDQAARNIAIDDNEIMARNSGQPSALQLNAEGGQISMGLYDIHPALAYGRVSESGSLLSGSDNITSTSRSIEGNYLVEIEGGFGPGDVMIVTRTKSTPGMITAYRSADRMSVVSHAYTDGFGIDSDFAFVVFRP